MDCEQCGSCVPYSPEMSCCDNWGDLDDDLLCRAIDLAWMTLRSLSGGLVGNCPVLVRPCLSAPCSACSGVMLQPRLVKTGDCESCWTNAPACGGDGCSCGTLSEIVLPGQVADIWQVRIDGVALPVTAYRVDNGNRLVRTDGQSWPSCQYMDRDVTSQDPAVALGTMGVWYVPGVRPSAAGLWAAGVLTCEFAKACSGGKCRLPSAVTSIARQGVTMEFSTGMFPDGMTGIREVDAYLTSINPYAHRTPPKVWSPDMPAHRYTTWQATPTSVAQLDVVNPRETGPLIPATTTGPQQFVDPKKKP
jgi:hypothetical protein